MPFDKPGNMGHVLRGGRVRGRDLELHMVSHGSDMLDRVENAKKRYLSDEGEILCRKQKH